jgi:hypothetical protein
VPDRPGTGDGVPKGVTTTTTAGAPAVVTTRKGVNVTSVWRTGAGNDAVIPMAEGATEADDENVTDGIDTEHWTTSGATFALPLISGTGRDATAPTGFTARVTPVDTPGAGKLTAEGTVSGDTSVPAVMPGVATATTAGT